MNVYVTSRCTWMNARQKKLKKRVFPPLNLNLLHHVSHTLEAKFRFAQVQCMQLVGQTVEVIHYSLQSPLKSLLLLLWRLHFCIIHFLLIYLFSHFLGKWVRCMNGRWKISTVSSSMTRNCPWEISPPSHLFFRCCHATFSFAEWKDEYHFWYGICRISPIIIKQKYLEAKIYLIHAYLYFWICLGSTGKNLVNLIPESSSPVVTSSVKEKEKRERERI